jgi:hypothetical protein
MSAETGKGPKRYGADLVLPVVASVYAVYYVASVWDFPPEAQRSGIALAGLLLTFTTLFFIRTALSVIRERRVFDMSPLLGAPDERMRRLGFVALIFIYLAVARHGGFTLTTFGFLFAGSLMAGVGSVRKAFLFALVSALAGWAFFIALLGTRFPEGPFERLVSGIF